MALVIEDGSVVAGANSFATVAETRAFALARGITLDADNAKVEAYLVSACDYLLSIEPRLQGARVSIEQELVFPRDGVVLFGIELAANAIPKALLQAQMSLAMEARLTPLLPADSGRVIKREKLDVIETEYMDSDTANPVPSFPHVEALLAPLLSSAGFGGFELMRV